MSKVSVIVPVYNVEQYIKRCLKSILDQSWQDFEILCVDDCGQDQSISIIEQRFDFTDIETPSVIIKSPAMVWLSTNEKSMRKFLVKHICT